MLLTSRRLMLAEFHTTKQEENLIDDLLRHGLHNPKRHKLGILRLALGLSLHIQLPPDEKWAYSTSKDGKPYKLERITGVQSEDSDGRTKNYENTIKAIMSVYHQQDMFADHNLFTRWLRAHVHRGLTEISNSWRPGNDFIDYLLNEFSSVWSNTSNTSEVTHQHTTDQLKNGLLEIGVSAKVVNEIIGARVRRYVLNFDDIHHWDNLKKGLEKLAVIMGINDGGIILKKSKEPRQVSLDIPKNSKEWQQITGSDLFDWSRSQVNSRNTFNVWLGKSVDGLDVAIQLTDLPHLMVAGTTGSGKSVCLHSIIVSLLTLNDQSVFQLALLDPKQVEFSQYQELKNLFGDEVNTNIISCANCLAELVEEMERRNNLMSSKQVRNLAELDDVDRPPLIFVFVEELADLVMQMGNSETHLIRLAQKARASGIHLILATQRPDAKTFSGLLRSNIPARIALRVQKQKESEIILDQGGAEKLLGKGDMLVKLPENNEPIRVHGGYIKQSDINYVQANLH